MIKDVDCWKIFDSVPFGATVWHVPTVDLLDIVLVYANHQADIESGFPISGLVGSSIRDAFPGAVDIPDDLNSPLKSLQVMQDGLPRTIRNMPFGAEGQPDRTFNLHISKADEEHVLIVYRGNADVPELKLVREIESKLLMLQNLPGYTIYTEFDGTILGVNKLHPGYSPEEAFIGSNLFDSSTPEANAEMRETVGKMVDGGLNEYAYVSEGQPPGHTFSTVVKKVKLPGNGVVLLWSAWDITAQIITQDKLKLANEDLEQFAYIVSHDLQEPIRTIAAYVDILLEDYPHLFETGEPEEFMTFIRDSALRQQHLIRDVLTYSRTSGMTFEPVSLERSFKNVVASLTSLIHRRNAIVEWEGRTDYDLVASQTYLEMALQNLIANAIKYTPADRVPVVRVSVVEEGHFWRINVRDNGIGIQPEYAEQVFKMFKRLHQGVIDTEGTGIGLPVCRRIARKHGGNCWFDSEPGKGSTFYLSIRKPLHLV